MQIKEITHVHCDLLIAFIAWLTFHLSCMLKMAVMAKKISAFDLLFVGERSLYNARMPPPFRASHCCLLMPHIIQPRIKQLRSTSLVVRSIILRNRNWEP